MNHRNNKNAIDLANRMHSLLAIITPIVNSRNYEPIENPRSKYKAKTVLHNVALVFRIIPLEFHRQM
jgi:hypothetical protein